MTGTAMSLIMLRRLPVHISTGAASREIRGVERGRARSTAERLPTLRRH
jgi:hypothetical protein